MSKKINITVDPMPAAVELIKLAFLESDRGMVIACSHYLEEIVADLLPNKMRGLGFDMKVSIFSLMYHDDQLTPILKVLVKTRNKASHSANVFTLKDRELSFLSNFFQPTSKLKTFKQVRDISINLKVPELIGTKSLGDLLKVKKLEPHNMRLKLCISTIVLSMYILALQKSPLGKLSDTKIKLN